MPDPEKRPPSRTVQVSTIVCVVIAIAVAQVVGPKWFPQPRGRFSIGQIVVSAVAGGLGGLLGVMVGMGINALRKGK
jgi:hypothetical protein